MFVAPFIFRNHSPLQSLILPSAPVRDRPQQVRGYKREHLQCTYQRPCSHVHSRPPLTPYLMKTLAKVPFSSTFQQRAGLAALKELRKG